MCGIAGEVDDRRPVDAGALAAMVEALAARGPDGSGLEIVGEAGLAHRRLAIIDRSDAGAQPFANEERDVWLVANGEIYNYRELGKELAAAGHRFRSSCDSEVILHAYEEWGDDCVLHLRGIFAFAIWDARRRRLLLARDRLGVKPLYWWRRPGGLAFASEPRALNAHPEFRAELDREAFAHYLAYRYVPGELSAYAGVRKLGAGQRLILERGSPRCERWWRPTYTPRIHDPREACEAVREGLDDAVRAQLASDVPVGVFLSGGLDSSAVAAAARRARGDALPAFTIGFDEAGKDERPYARLAARHLGAALHERRLDAATLRAALPELFELHDEPFWDDSSLATSAVARLARQHDTPVVLTGDGGDELFAGYRWYERFLAEPVPRGPRRWLRRALRRPLPDAAERYFRQIGILDAPARRLLLGKGADVDALDFLRRRWRDDVPPITALQLLDLESFLVDDVLTKVDRATMAHGVEARVPFLDDALVETALSIDAEIVYARGERKALLRRALSDGLPGELCGPRKQGFSVELARRLGPALHDDAARLIDGGSLVSRGALRGDGARELLGRNDPKTSWLLFCAELWARRWLEGLDPRAELAR